ncbi:MAG: hypothetical protein Q9182_003007 [Xanthomendoza sp. 2 TL-2023]
MSWSSQSSGFSWFSRTIAKEEAEQLISITETENQEYYFENCPPEECYLPWVAMQDQREAEQLISITQAEQQKAFFRHFPLELFDQYDVPWATEPEYRVVKRQVYLGSREQVKMGKKIQG